MQFKICNLGTISLLILQFFVVQNYSFAAGGRGVGFYTYLSSKAERNLINILFEHREELRSYLHIENYQESPLSEVHCKFHIWKNIKEAETFAENRLECEVYYKNYKKSRVFLMLSEDEISPLGISVDPSIRIKGPTAALLSRIFSNLGKSEDNAENAAILSTKYFDGEDQVFYLDSQDEERPILICSNSENWCDLRWPKLQADSTRVSLGENSDLLVKAMCGWNAGVTGKCPRLSKSMNNVQCDFVGLWVPYDNWGIIDTKPAIECSYWENNAKEIVRLDLGPVLTKPWGNRWANSSGVTLRGMKLKKLYQSLSAYVESLDVEKRRDHAISAISLPGRAGFSSNSVSLRRAREASEGLASLDCEEIDVSHETYFRDPVADDFLLPERRYECVIQTAAFLRTK